MQKAAGDDKDEGAVCPRKVFRKVNERIVRAIVRVGT